MNLSLPQFVEALSASGLMSADELSAFRAKLPETPAGNPTEGLARELVRQGKLTSFQVNAVYQGKTRGLVFGEYVVLDKLGAGGMGRVFRARHRRMDRIVALKVLPKEVLSSAQAVERFEREVRAAARLHHAHIVTAYDAGVHEGIHYLVMEYVAGRDLGTIIRDGGPLEIGLAIDYVIQAARGLSYAHEQGVVHRDIKPGNLLVSNQGTLKILDMGLARIDEGAIQDSKATQVEGLTHTGQVLGTLDYMAPEQAEDVAAADARSDVYALGCTLFRMLTGRPPYQADSVLRKLLAHREKPIPDVRDDRPETPAELAAAITQMLAKFPEDRPESMLAVIAILEAVPKAAAAPSPRFDRAALLAEEDELSGYYGSVAAFPTRASVARATEKAQRPESEGNKQSIWRSLLLAGAALAALGGAIAAGAYWFQHRSATLEFEWSASQRAGAQLEIDGAAVPLPAQGKISISVSPGRRKVEILRRGYEPNQYEVDLAPGERKLLILRWKQASISSAIDLDAEATSPRRPAPAPPAPVPGGK